MEIKRLLSAPACVRMKNLAHLDFPLTAFSAFISEYLPVSNTIANVNNVSG